MSRVLVVGLDCLEPSLAFERFADAMPNLSRLRAAGRWGPLRSCVPPVTVPAWAVMTSGASPGRLGLYGLRNRVPGSYALEVATSRSVRVPRIWDVASDAGRRVVVLGVPPTWPPSPVHGDLVSCFLAPGTDRPFTHPVALADELRAKVGAWRLDVADYRSDDLERVLREIHEITDQRFAAARHLLATRDWGLAMTVDMGPDRLHHAFWRFFAEDHPRHEPGTAFADAGRRYYAHVDAALGGLLEVAGTGTTVLVVSDHGARTMMGGVCVNEWLIREGLLVLRETPARPTPLLPDMVDWSRTRAWAEGGYHGRVMLNVRGREPEGIVDPEEYERLRSEIARGLGSVVPGTRAARPEEAYEEVTGLPPDLIFFFGDLAFRAVGSVGTGAIRVAENDTGPDGANHAWDGVFVLAGEGVRGSGPVAGCVLQDVAATVLDALAIGRPAGMGGASRL